MEELKKPPELRFANLSPTVWEELGKIPRTGWVKRGVKDPETVQEHTVSLRILAATILDEFTELSEQDKEDLIDMLEIHDWPEALVGDEVILTTDPTERKRLKEEKNRKEDEAMRKICEGLGKDGERILSLWLRFEEETDVTSIIAKQIDKHQSIEKAFEYEKSQGIPLFQEFRDSYRGDITHPALLKRLEALK